jgi:tRNA-binding protein
MSTISWDDFAKVDIRAGTIIKAEPFPEARNPAYIIHVDLGPKIGVKKSSAQITGNYPTDQLINKQVMCVVNFPVKQIGPIQSQVLILGFDNENGDVVLATVDEAVPNGTKLH